MDAVPEGLPARLAEYRRLADDVRAVRDGIDRIRATAYSPDGLVAATVGGRGELVDLDLDPRVYRDPDATALGAAIADTIRAAADSAEQDAVALAERLVRVRAGTDVDPLFDPVLHLIDTEPERSQRLWPT
ncbi:YbaB/EbfC family nucleoid-associated protein [Plantactinospora sp. WMMB782]|uniref:YbaB/EbfC family nucleoid-associated protein n=1 Tax=Plantactinospora sp. WMMB782 TaxID=3404121 RepID=UPI003B92D0CD